MRRRCPKHRCVILLTAAITSMMAVSVRPSDSYSESGTSLEEVPEVYTVVPRDTLWDLAERFFSDPFKWRQIWNANKHISDPDWIFPGDLLSIHSATQSEILVTIDSLGQDENLEVLEVPEFSNIPELSADPETFETRELISATEDFEDAIAPSYIDNLIDPEVAHDNYFDTSTEERDSSGLFGRIDQSIEFHSQYRKTTFTDSDFNGAGFGSGLQGNDAEDGRLDLGLHYIARRNTRNWGNFRLNLIFLDDDPLNAGTNNFGFNGAGFATQRRQTGLARFSIEQYNLPINDRLSLNTIFGTHRQARYNPFRERPNLINSRFSSSEPDVLGASFQLLSGKTGLSVSGGRLGQSQGSVLPGFVRTSGDIKRVQATHVRDRNAFTADVWQTKNQDIVDNRNGYRLGYDHLLRHNTVLSLNAAGSGSSNAFLLGGSTKTELSQHDFGSYFFDPDFIWLDQRIGDDNVGVFYRYQTRASVNNWGGSIEVRKDGLSDTAARSSTSAFASLNMAHRLNRRATLSNVYSFRNVSFSDSNNETTREHSLRSYYSTAHGSNSRSNISALGRLGTNQEELMLGYGWSKGLQNDSNLELRTTYRLIFGTDEPAREWLVGTNWNKQFARGTYLSAGLGYNFGRSELDDNEGFTGHVNLEQTFGPNFSLSMQLDYSQEETSFNPQNFDDSFFTDSQFGDENTSGSRQFFALLSLRYQRNGQANSEVLNGRGNGAGSVRGFVFVDSNNDGIRQSSEPGVPGITVFLNSVYPVLTNSRGEYSFPNVGLGSHYLFIDETALPLPWTLRDGEYSPLSVTLRRSTQVNIPISPLTLAEAEQ